MTSWDYPNGFKIECNNVRRIKIYLPIAFSEKISPVNLRENL